MNVELINGHWTLGIMGWKLVFVKAMEGVSLFLMAEEKARTGTTGMLTLEKACLETYTLNFYFIWLKSNCFMYICFLFPKNSCREFCKYSTCHLEISFCELLTFVITSVIRGHCREFGKYRMIIPLILYIFAFSCFTNSLYAKYWNYLFEWTFCPHEIMSLLRLGVDSIHISISGA